MEYLELGGDMNRRVFVRGLGYVSLGVIMWTLGDCEALAKQMKNRPVRPHLRTGSPQVAADVATYKDAVSAMKSLPSSDPRSWSAQAALHGTVTGGFNFCQHGTDHFFSWHRAYLLYFERICQELTGDKHFGLPYWNWNQNPAMHPAFTDPASPLNHTRVNTSVAGINAFSNSQLDTIFADANFFTFSSQLEGTPHNTAHVVVSGDMATGGSPLDPIFWAHHCMVDYCWAKWNIELGNDNTNDPAWTGVTWTHFVDQNGDPVSVSAGMTPLMALLDYRYESSAIGGAEALPGLRAAEYAKALNRLKKGADIKFNVRKRVRIAEGARARMGRPLSKTTPVRPEELTTLIEADRTRDRVFASIEYAQLPDVNDFFMRVFVNLPSASSVTPTDDPHFAGSFAFFGTDRQAHGDHHHKTDFLVDVTPTLQRLRRMGRLSEKDGISVQLVAVPARKDFSKPETELVLKNLDLIVSPVMIRSK